LQLLVTQTLLTPNYHPLVKRGSNAAFVQEAVERAKLSAVASSEEMKVTPKDIEIAVASMQSHIKMVCPDAGTENFNIEEGDQVIDPIKLAMDLLMDQAAFALIHKIANPKTLEKIIIKAEKRGRRGGSPFSNN